MQIDPLKKALQKFQVLTSDTEFMSDIYNLRQKWNIPKIGFKKDTAKWQDEMDTKSDEVMSSKKFQNELNKIWEQKNNLSKKGNTDNWKKIEEDNRKVQRLIPYNEFGYNLRKLREKYNLSAYYENYIKQFLFFNDIKLSVPLGNLRMKQGKDENGEPFLSLQIFAETTIKDIQRQWKIIKLHQKKLRGYRAGRFKKVVKIDRNKRVIELAEQGKTEKEIKDIIKEEFPKEKLPYEYISKIKGRFKTKIKKEKTDI
jgi:hypothetical protein